MARRSIESREAVFELLTPDEVLHLMFDRDLADAYQDCVKRSGNSLMVDRNCYKLAYNRTYTAYNE